MSISGLKKKRRKREGTARLKEVTKLIDELRADMAASKEDMNQQINESKKLMNTLWVDLTTSKEETSQRINETMNMINKLRADMVSKEEMKQLIHASARTNLPHKELSDSNIWSIRHIFTNSYLDGLRELTDVNLNRILRAVWFLILFVNLALLAFAMRPIVKDFINEVTITKVGQIATDMSQLNQPAICLNLFEDFLYLRSKNSSRNNLQQVPVNNESLLYLGYIKAMMPIFASSGLWLSHIPSENLTWSQFQSIPARPSLSISYEKASLLSQNTLYDVLYYWGIGQINLTTSEQSKFHYNKKFYSEILVRQTFNSEASYQNNSRVCLPINLTEIGWVAVNGKQDEWFTYEHYVSGERTNLSLVHQRGFETQHFSTKTYSAKIPYPYSYLESIYRYKKDTTRYFVVPTKYIHLNLTRQPCYDAFGEIYPRGFGEFICFQDCMWDNHAILFNCSFWEDMNPDEQQNINVCHVFDIFHQLRFNMSQMCTNDHNQSWCNDQAMRSVEEWSKLLMQTYRELMINNASVIGDCQSKCVNFTFCEEWEMQYEVIYKHDQVKFINDTTGPNSKAGLIAYRAYAISSFVSVNEDVLKASREEFLSSLGGIIGFHFGASLCGYLHLLLFLLITCCRKITKIVNKLRTVGRRSIEE